MSISPAPPQSSQAPRVRKRIYIPLILLVLLLAVAVVFYVRGTWADKEERNPSGPASGTLTQLLEQPDGNVVVRCALVVDAPPKDVWATINDYSSHKDFLPYVTKLEATRQAEGVFIDGIAYSRLWQEWPFQCLVIQKENPTKGVYSALWSEEDKGEFKVNRGGWTIRPFDKSAKQTLLTFTLQIEMEKYPNFLVRNIIMDRLFSVVKAMGDESVRRKQKT